MPEHYEDTKDGARRLLQDEADPRPFPGLATARFRQDPYVAGAWLVTGEGWAVLVYVGSHPLAPDFEEVDGDVLDGCWDSAAR